MHPVHILGRDICGGHADLVIIPCSGKLKDIEKPRNQQRIDYYGLPRPSDLRGTFGYGKVSPIFPPTKNIEKIRYFAFAASVFDSADPDGLRSIGEQIGLVTRNQPNIRLVEAPFLGCGDGGLTPIVAIPALAKGFLSSYHPDSTLQICSDSALSAAIASRAIFTLFEEIHREKSVGPEDPVSRAGEYAYAIALSFASEQRSFAEALSALLEAHGVRVFYDNDEQADLWGRNLYDELFETYSTRSRYCVILVSDAYSRKLWTNHERRAAQDRAFRENGNAYILPIHFDRTRLAGLPSTIGHVNAVLGVERIVELLLSKLE